MYAGWEDNLRLSYRYGIRMVSYITEEQRGEQRCVTAAVATNTTVTAHSKVHY